MLDFDKLDQLVAMMAAPGEWSPRDSSVLALDFGHDTEFKRLEDGGLVARVRVPAKLTASGRVISPDAARLEAYDADYRLIGVFVVRQLA